MYVETIFCENMGPIEKAVIKAGFTPEGNPKPIVLVGKNGSGKSIMLSNIVDALHEIGDQAFSNITKKSHNGHKYLKIASGSQIRIGKTSLCGFVSFIDDDKKRLEYIYTWGGITNNDVKNLFNGIGLPTPAIQIDSDSGKAVTNDVERVRKAFRSSVLTYFPAYRYELPDWLGEEYAFAQEREYDQRHYKDELACRIIVDSARRDTNKWLEDVLSNSKPDLILEGNHWQWTPYNDLTAVYQQTRKNIAIVLSKILGEDVDIVSNKGHVSGCRIAIFRRGTKVVVSPTYDSLSTGQAILADVFLTIIRYADTRNAYIGSSISSISGIVIIDEVDSHLHSALQHQVLPALMRLFPKVQFIVTAHAPLFVLGMEKEYGEDGFDVYEMPECNRISAESYREFQKAFDWLQESKTAQARQRKLTEEAINAVRSQLTPSINDEILVVTEGCTDWKHMEHALSKLSADYPELCGKVRFWHYHPKGKGNGEPEFDMGDSEVVRMCDQIRKLRQSQKIVFIVDADHPEKTKELIKVGATYKNWGNNVYSFQIPNSELRPDFTTVCIEHYYTDNELKTEIEFEGVKRRLFLSGEFTKRNGQTKDHQFFYENIQRLKKAGQYDIIEGDQGNRVTKLVDDSDNPVNFALSKNTFASEMLAGNQALANVSVEAFKKIFDVLKQIASEPMVNAMVANTPPRPIHPIPNA